MTSPADRIAGLQAQLTVSRAAVGVYQEALKRALANLGMLGRGDVAKTIASDVLKCVQSIPGITKQEGTDDDDDLAG